MERHGSHHAERVGRWLGRWLYGPAGLAVHLGLFLLGATLLTLLNLLRSPAEIWFWRPLGWWGALLIIHAGLTLGGLLRSAGVNPSAPRTRPIAPEAHSRSDGSRARALGGGAARVGAVASARIGGGVVAAARLVGGRLGGRSVAAEPPAGWTAEDDAAFTSWAEATNSWSSLRTQGVAPNGHLDGWHASAPNGGSPDANGDNAIGGGSSWAQAAADGGHGDGGTGATVPSPSPVPTGRFRNGEPPNAPRTPAAENGSAAGEWVPAAVEALWETTPARSRPAETGTTAPTPPQPAAPVPTAVGPPAVERRRAVQNGRDVVLSGPVPADPNDPQWTRLEAAAEAWLAQREAGPAPTRFRDEPAPTGTDGAATPQA